MAEETLQLLWSSQEIVLAYPGGLDRSTGARESRELSLAGGDTEAAGGQQGEP